MFAPLPTPQEMSLWDQAAMTLGIPGVVLMENASREAYHALQECVGSVNGKRILLFMGNGNNGGDAACLARHLLDAGAIVLVVHTQSLAAYEGITRQHIRIARQCGVSFLLVNKWRWKYSKSVSRGCDDSENAERKVDSFKIPFFGIDPDIVIDGLLGTGFSGMLRPLAAELVARINDLSRHAFLFAIDIPSGLSGLTGKPQPVAVRAHATVTFEAAKPGLVLPEAAPYTGTLLVRPIGLPLIVRQQIPASYQLMTSALAEALPVPEPGHHKGTSGSVLILGGSVDRGNDLTGAAHLAAWGALRAGAGLVSVGAPEEVCQKVKGGCPDIMARSLGLGSRWSQDALHALLASVTGQGSGSGSGFNLERSSFHKVDAVVIGPGLGRTLEASAFVRAYLALEDRPPTVIDADALYALGDDPLSWHTLRPSDILTPHPGEAGYLLGISAEAVQSDRFAALEALAQKSDAIWVLKGAGTLIGGKDHLVTISPYDAPNLAVGGSGDVLAGCLGAILAQRAKKNTSRLADERKEEYLIAACLGVLLHGEAGRLLAETFPLRGNTATDIADTLPGARASLLQEKKET